MSNLIWNELTKIYLQKSTWIMYIGLTILVIGLALMINNFTTADEQYSSDTWREQLIEENAEIEEDIAENPNAAEFVAPQLERNLYHLEEDIMPRNFDAFSLVQELSMATSFISLLVVIVAAGIIANEFRWGTIKQLLIRPISRGKILISKYISVLIFAFLTLIFFATIGFIMGLILTGIDHPMSQVVVMREDGYQNMPMVLDILVTYGFKIVHLVMMVTFAFMISVLFRNSALAIGLSIFLMFSGVTIVNVLSRYDWVKYILFAHTDLTIYHLPYPLPNEDMTMTFSIIVLIVYWLIFMAISYIFFTKQDVAGE